MQIRTQFVWSDLNAVFNRNISSVSTIRGTEVEPFMEVVVLMPGLMATLFPIIRKLRVLQRGADERGGSGRAGRQRDEARWRTGRCGAAGESGFSHPAAGLEEREGRSQTGLTSPPVLPVLKASDSPGVALNPRSTSLR